MLKNLNSLKYELCMLPNALLLHCCSLVANFGGLPSLSSQQTWLSLYDFRVVGICLPRMSEVDGSAA